MKAHLSNEMEFITRDYEFLSNFIHTREIWDGGMLTYSDTHFENLETAIWDHLDKDDRIVYEQTVEALTGLISTALDSLTHKAKKVIS